MSRIATITRRILERCEHAPAPAGMPPELGPCCLWMGPTSAREKPKNGARGHSYPRFSLDGQTVAVHRVVWVNKHGYLPSRAQLDHLCKRRRCVALKHLEKVTHKVNQRRRRKAAEPDQWTQEERNVIMSRATVALKINRLPERVKP